MASMRTWMWIATAVAAGSSMVLSACSSCEPESAPPAPTAAPAPAAADAGQPPAAPPAAANQPALDVDELYVDAEADPDEGSPPLTVKFTSTVEDATGAVTCEWDFGDGTAKSTEMNPTHTYDKVGDYVAALRCKDSKGIEGETEIDVTAYEDE
jgi:PKD repeat protein